MHTTNAELYHDENDSGYQEPHEVINTLNRHHPHHPHHPHHSHHQTHQPQQHHHPHHQRLMVSSPTRIENPNIPPLNTLHPYPHRSGSLTANRKATLSRRTTETLNYYGQGSNM